MDPFFISMDIHSHHDIHNAIPPILPCPRRKAYISKSFPQCDFITGASRAPWRARGRLGPLESPDHGKPMAISGSIHQFQTNLCILCLCIYIYIDRYVVWWYMICIANIYMIGRISWSIEVDLAWSCPLTSSHNFRTWVSDELPVDGYEILHQLIGPPRHDWSSKRRDIFIMTWFEKCPYNAVGPYTHLYIYIYIFGSWMLT